MISQVLVPFNGSPEARQSAEIAAGLAKSLRTKLVVLAFDSEPAETGPYGSLNDFVDIVRGRYGLEPDVIALDKFRFISDELVSISRNTPGTVICTTADNRGRLSLLNLSTATDVLTYTDAPVVLVGPKCERFMFEHDGPMLVALDGTVDSEKILNVSTEWADALDLPIEVVTVLDPEPVAALSGAMASGDVHESSYVSRLVKISPLSDREASFTVRHGNPADEVRRAAFASDASLVAVASRVPLGVDRLLRGSVLDSIAQNSPVPVLALNHHPFLG